ncbi:uncharacterized protein NECHADRAFT_82057 [Fusarium vanettenii 77-13-4]|uniref:Uncharacterized protein n=1 Tax=Fusarium vanettenii (strain ATCC MYA-4622 / CBS 123669 / FGSC 9596 / NRRL 45880 / 77-13-4) TaxID=660122 RepID=C7ZAD1_FUSV7|nr:uncharacterized protein NECHADRAFT_82057 [Fusarium vanettenii 77-13-4]EEU39254.1 predicted protein [Fusarium vanettenii 77-13-4]
MKNARVAVVLAEHVLDKSTVMCHVLCLAVILPSLASSFEDLKEFGLINPRLAKDFGDPGPGIAELWLQTGAKKATAIEYGIVVPSAGAGGFLRRADVHVIRTPCDTFASLHSVRRLFLHCKQVIFVGRALWYVGGKIFFVINKTCDEGTAHSSSLFLRIDVGQRIQIRVIRSIKPVLRSRLGTASCSAVWELLVLIGIVWRWSVRMTNSLASGWS